MGGLWECNGRTLIKEGILGVKWEDSGVQWKDSGIQLEDSGSTMGGLWRYNRRTLRNI